MAGREIIIKDTHRGLWYEDGVLLKVLAPAGTSCQMWHGFPSSAGRKLKLSSLTCAAVI